MNSHLNKESLATQNQSISQSKTKRTKNNSFDSSMPMNTTDRNEIAENFSNPCSRNQSILIDRNPAVNQFRKSYFSEKVSKLTYGSSLAHELGRITKRGAFKDITTKRLMPRLKIFRILRNPVPVEFKKCVNENLLAYFDDPTMGPKKTPHLFKKAPSNASPAKRLNSFFTRAKKKDDESAFKKNAFMFRLREWFNQISEHSYQKEADWGMFSPSGPIVFLLNIFFVLSMGFFVIAFPIMFGFSLEAQLIEKIMIGVKLFLVCDQIAMLNTGFYQHGRPILKRSLTFWNVFQRAKLQESLFFLGLVSSLTITFMKFENQLVVFFTNIPIALKIKSAMSRQSKVQQFLQLSSAMIQFLWVIKLMMLLIFFGHLCACTWFFIGAYEERNHLKSWLDSTYFDSGDFYHQYIASYYWAVMTMSTVGYGDIVANTNLERTFSISVMIMSSLLFAYTVSSIGGVLSRIEEETVETRRKEAVFNSFLSEKKIPGELKGRVQHYIQYALERSARVKGEERRLFELLPNHLKKEVKLEINGSLLTGSQNFICSIFSEHLVVALTETMTENFYMPQDSIISKENKMQRSMYIVQSGEYRTYLKKSHKTLACKSVILFSFGF